MDGMNGEFPQKAWYQRSEPLRRRDMLDGSLHEDLMQLRIKQDQRTEDRIKQRCSRPGGMLVSTKQAKSKMNQDWRN